MPRRSKSQPDPLATFPEWARRLAERYYTKTVSTFILHGAVRDLQPADDGKGGRRFVPLRTFLSDELFGSRDLVVFYDRSSGIRLATSEMQKDFMAAVAGYDTLFASFLESLPDGGLVMCHPGFVDAELERLDHLTAMREQEYAFFAGEAFPKLLAERGFALA